VFLKRYSTFALSESEEERGYTLLCRAMPEEDLVVELLHFDVEDYRLDVPIQTGRGTVRAVEVLTRDIRRLVLDIAEPVEFTWRPGQYIDLLVPGERELHRSFSMANLPGERTLELMIKKYPRGLFSGKLDGGILPGDELVFQGPYGTFHLHDSHREIVMVAGGSGMAPVLCLLRQLAQDGTGRRVRFFYGARAENDLFHLDEIEKLGTRLADFQFVPVLSEREPMSGWSGAEGLVHEELRRYLDTEGPGEFEVYMCGPPLMIEAIQEMLVEGRGHDPNLIFWDKFTAAADPESD
jgi:propane monooxygenase reductase subunit